MRPMNRKTLVAIVLTAAAATAVRAAEPAAPGVTGDAALKELMAGNARYVAGKATRPHQDAARRTELAKGQKPPAVILACADSRVAPEILFDQGLGDLFVVRVAGNIADANALGSIEYATAVLGSRLVVVLGHERCGAVDAAVGAGDPPGHIKSITDAIRPAITTAAKAKDDVLDRCVRANVSHQVALLQKDETLSTVKDLKIVGARYDLDDGQVALVPWP